MISLSRSEYEILTRLAGKVAVGQSYTAEDLARIAGVDRSKVEALIRLLASRTLGLVEYGTETVVKVVPTEEGRRYLQEGFPEERLVEILRNVGGRLKVSDARRLLGEELARIALSNAVKLGWVQVREGVIESLVGNKQPKSPDREALLKVVEGRSPSPQEVERLRRRRLVSVERESKTIVRFLKDPSEILSMATIEVGALTRDMLREGLWRRARLRRYDVTALPPRVRFGRAHFLAEFIEYIRDVMKELGFVEVDDSPIELEFWNYDVLFQPQFHPSRTETDTFYLAYPSMGVIDEELALRVKEAHERGAAGSRGWGYVWSREKAARLILRSHTTAVSARVLASRPRPPFRFFTIGRVYRVESVDARHLPEFHQVDGIASEDGVTVRWLLGMLSEFLERLGIREYKFRPAYFPFTEPSYEGYVRVRGMWLEVLGSGLFRPEMLEPLGISYPVAAWGMGVERLAMAIHGLEDIRHLYTLDVDRVLNMEKRWAVYAGSQV
ncbi:MAG: phenylalanine--tRNA ligase subunit alpha [Thermoproteota archaeon]